MVRANVRACTLSALLSLGPVVHADGLLYGVDAGVGESDNVTLSSSNKVSQTIAVADLDFSMKGAGSHLTENVAGNFTYLDFLQHEYSREFLGRFNGVGSYALIPDQLAWNLQDSWGQAQIDPFGSLVPTNQQNVNFLSTGPTWYARLGSTSFLDVSGLYSRADYQRTELDSDRLQGAVKLGHEISAQSSISANAQVQRIYYKNTILNTDYNLERFYLRYELHGARTDIALDGGIDKEVTSGRPSSGFMAKLDVSRRVSQSATLDFAVGRMLTDASGGFNTQQTSNAPGAVNPTSPVNAVTNYPSLFTSSVFTGNYVVASWRYQRARTTLNVFGWGEKDTYVYAPQFNDTRERVDVNLERRLTHALSIQAYGNFALNHYGHDQFVSSAPGYSERDGLYGIAVTLHEGRGLEIRLRGSHLARNVTAGAGSGYSENRIFLTVGYRPAVQP